MKGLHADLAALCCHRALNPARAAAATLLRYQQTAGAAPEGQARQAASGEEGSGPPGASELQILGVEHFSREPQDW